MMALRFRPRGVVAASAMLLLTGCASVTMQPANRLTPVRDRVTDEAIARDLAIFDAYDRRISTAAPNPTGAQRYVATRAAEYVQIARDAYERNDRTSFVDDALAWAASDIETLERGASEGALTSAVPIPAASNVDPAMWARAEGLRRSATTLVAPQDVALAEGQLIRAAHPFLAGPACVDEAALAAATRLLREAEERGTVPPPLPPTPTEQPAPVTPTPVTPTPANPTPTRTPETPRDACSAPDVLAGVPSIVHFALDKSYLAPATKTVLDALIARLKDAPGLRVVLSGHTDIRASDDYNQALSERRVESVRRYLLENGLDPKQLSVRAYGEKRVLTTGTKIMDHARNRRVALTYIRCDGSEAQPIEQLSDIQLEAARRAIMKEKD